MDAFNYLRAVKLVGVTGALWLGGKSALFSSSAFTHYTSCSRYRLCLLAAVWAQSPSLRILFVPHADFESGNIAALSFIAIPALRQSSVIDGVPVASLAKQWRHIYETGKSQNPPVAVIAASAFLYLSWSAKRALPKSPIALYYGSAAVLTLSIVPFTLIAMSATNSKLMQQSHSSAKSVTPVHAQDDEIDQLLGKWTRLNAVRGLLPVIGGIVGLVASLP